MNDNREIKIAIVKPTPANEPTPIICFQLAPVGSCAILSLMANLDIRNIPNGFPKQSPKIIPIPKRATLRSKYSKSANQMALKLNLGAPLPIKTISTIRRSLRMVSSICLMIRK